MVEKTDPRMVGPWEVFTGPFLETDSVLMMRDNGSLVAVRLKDFPGGGGDLNPSSVDGGEIGGDATPPVGGLDGGEIGGDATAASGAFDGGEIL